MTTTKETILKCAEALGVTMTAEFVPLSKSRNAGGKYPTLNWKVTLHKDGRPFLTTDFSAGAAHAPSYPYSKSMDGAEALRYECEHGKAVLRPGQRPDVLGIRGRMPILPDFADVLHSLSMDASVLDHPTYETWAADYGFDPDSRKGEATYRECLSLALKMRGALGDDGLRRLAEATADY